jgi:thiosulfate/3-mercaptopyruvate sulfurtransferase
MHNMNLLKHLLHCRGLLVLILMAATTLLITPVAGAQTGGKDGGPAKTPSAVSELTPGSQDLIRPEDLAKALQSSAKPTVLNVGPRVIYVQAHIPGAEFIGPTNKPEGLAKLRTRAHSMSHDSFVVIYCGCCPWEHCPNVRPAYQLLKQMGFTRLKVLYIATSFGSDWVEKGYPTAKGE